MSAEEAEAKIADLKTGTFTMLLTKALRYKNNKGIKVTETVDDEATNKAIRNSINQSEYKNGLTICLKVLKKRVAYGTVKIFTHQAEKGETSMHSITKKPLRMLLK